MQSIAGVCTVLFESQCPRTKAIIILGPDMIVMRNLLIKCTGVRFWITFLRMGYCCLRGDESIDVFVDALVLPSGACYRCLNKIAANTTRKPQDENFGMEERLRN